MLYNKNAEKAEKMNKELLWFGIYFFLFNIENVLSQ